MPTDLYDRGDQFRPTFPDRWHATHGSWRRKYVQDDPIPPEVFCFGIEFSDGAKATNLDDRRSWYGPETKEMEPESPILLTGGGGGSPSHMRSNFWVWPIPPEGSLTFVLQWPAKGIDLVRVPIDADPIRAAAPQAEQLFKPTPGLYAFTHWG